MCRKGPSSTETSVMSSESCSYYFELVVAIPFGEVGQQIPESPRHSRVGQALPTAGSRPAPLESLPAWITASGACCGIKRS